MNEFPTTILVGLLVLLIVLSAFFSGSETALMSINRYRLKHLAKAGHRGAIYAHDLLKKPDRLIGLILLGNNFVNILAASLATLLAQKYFTEEIALLASTLILTPVLLVFAETAPKTLAALRPEKLAFPSAYVYYFSLKALFPIRWIVRIVNLIANGWLRLLGVSQEDVETHSLTREELQTVVHEAGAMIPKRHQKMLLNILDLEQVTVEDIMIPRNDIDGIDLDDDWDDILDQIHYASHSRIVVFNENIDNILGFLHLRKVLQLVSEDNLNKATLQDAVAEAYFIPEGTTLTKQLLNFQKEKKHIGLVVDEYGDIQGLVSIADILEEIVGEFSYENELYEEIYPQKDGSFLVDAGIHIRDLNKALSWNLPTDGPKTLNGMILEYMEMIPEPGTSLLLKGYPIEIVKTLNYTVKTIRVLPTIGRKKFKKRAI